MNRPVVYLAGPIAGTRKGEAFKWRDYAALQLSLRDIDTLSPLRAKRALVGGDIGNDFSVYAHDGWAYTPAAILARDHHDAISADAILMNMLGTETMSFGTGMELAWAYDRHVPTVVSIEHEGNIHDKHPMFHAAVKFRLDNLDDAIEAVANILGR